MTDHPTKILLFGGTFDPPHLAHAQLPPIAAQQLGCDRIIYIPASINPLKSDAPSTPAFHRLAMLRLAIESIPNAEIDTIELDRTGPSFTVDTLEALHRRLGPEVELHLLIGADAALSFERWKDWRRILDLANPVIMPRPPHDQSSLIDALRSRLEASQATFWIECIMKVPYLDISATDIRSRIDHGADLSTHLDAKVISYIQAHKLYET